MRNNASDYGLCEKQLLFAFSLLARVVLFSDFVHGKFADFFI